MERVPTEVLHNIFSKLELEERLPCTLVCRKWWRVLDECSLLNSVNISYNEGVFSRFMDMIDQFPHRAMQVEELYLFDTIPTSFNKRTLLDIFPNLHVLEVEYDYEKESYNSQPIQMKQSTSKLKILHDSTHCEITSQLLTSNLADNLEQLHLYFESVRSISTRNLLDQLNNLPVLNELTLHSVSLGINDIENIHHNIPSIRIFGLYDFTIVDSKTPVSISPVTSITTFNIDIDYADNADTHIQLYQYMTEKYCKVDYIECYDGRLSNYNEHSRKRIYLNVIMDFYKVTAPKQTSFNIQDVPPGVNILDVFDEADCKLEDVSISNCQDDMLQQLPQSKQSRYIQKLMLKMTDLSSIRSIKSMEALTTLTLSFHERDPPIIDLTDCLNACPPTLKQFVLFCHSIKVDMSNVHLNYIDTLEIACNNVDRALADTISSSFPKLVTLNLHGEITEDICITLPNPSFQEANFNIPLEKPYGMTFKTPNQVAPQHYTVIEGGCDLVEYEQIRHLPMLTVSCFTEKILKFFEWVEILPI